jgi:general stress protein YciG
MDLESISGAMEINTKVSGRPVSDMDKAVILLLEEMFMSESTPGERLKDMVSTLGKMEIYTPGSFSTDRKMAREAGRKVGMPIQILIKATTSWTRSMDMESLSGALGVNTKETTKMILKKDMVRCIGSMVVSIEASGRMESNPA